MFTRILVAIDLAHEEQTAELFRIAATLAAGNEATLDLLYVDQSLVHRAGYPHLDRNTYGSHKTDAKQRMTALLAGLPANLKGVPHCRQGIAHDKILETAKQLGSDAIVITARKPGMRSYFIGSNAERVVRHADCSVFVVRGETD